MNELKSIIEQAFDQRASIQPGSAPAKVGSAVAEVLALLDRGELCVAQKLGNDWVTNEWVKKAVLLSFRLEEIFAIIGGEFTRYFVVVLQCPVAHDGVFLKTK